MFKRNLEVKLVKPEKGEKTPGTFTLGKNSVPLEAIVGAAFLGVLGFIAGGIVFSRGTRISVAPVFNNMLNNSSSVNFAGHTHKIVRCLDSGELFMTATEAAEKAGVTQWVMSRHLNGHKDHVLNKQYEVVGLGARS